MATIILQVGASTVSVRGAEARFLGELVRQEFAGHSREPAADAFATRLEELADSATPDEHLDLAGDDRRLARVALDAVHLARPFMLTAGLRHLRDAILDAANE